MSSRSRVSLLVALSLLAGVDDGHSRSCRPRSRDRCAGSRDLKLVNGKIHTFDARNSIVSSATIKNGKISWRLATTATRVAVLACR